MRKKPYYPNMRFLRSPLFWLVFLGGLTLMVIFFRALFGPGTELTSLACFIGGGIYGSFVVYLWSKR
jgi:hypothetical protein